MEPFKETLRAIEVLFPKSRDGNLLLKPTDLTDLPFWLKAAVDVYLLEIPDLEHLQLTLIQPKTTLTFDQIQNVYRQVSLKTGPNTLLVADNINPRNRPLLVKFRIPFVYKDETIFAPELAMVLKNIRSFEEKKPHEASLQKELHPLSVKIVAGYLTGMVEKEFHSKHLLEDIVRRDGSPSAAKLSNVLNELVNLGFLATEGAGPQKRFIFEDRQIAWELLQTTSVVPLMRAIQVHFIPGSEAQYILAGETALARYSNLAQPTVVTKAIALSNYNTMDKSIKESQLNRSDELGAIIQLWRESPHLYSSDAHLINPIELYLTMREHGDERIQIALTQMLSRHGLKPMERG